MSVHDDVAHSLASAVLDGSIRSYGVVTVDARGVVDRTVYCTQKGQVTELHGAIALLARGAQDFHFRKWPPVMTPTTVAKAHAVTVAGNTPTNPIG